MRVSSLAFQASSDFFPSHVPLLLALHFISAPATEAMDNLAGKGEVPFKSDRR